MKKKYILFLMLLFSILLTSSTLFAQSKNSVYSMFGVGQIIDHSYGINKSLGGTGIAFKSGRTINYLNPASHIGMFPGSFIMEVGAFGILNRYKNNNVIQTEGDINASYFSAGLYFKDWWCSNFGIVPFSYVNYEINLSDAISSGQYNIDKTYTGTGSLNKVYWGNSFKIYKNLTFGFNAAYIFGSITQSETADEGNNFSGYELAINRIAYGFYSDYGLQYTLDRNDLQYTMGLVYGANKTLGYENNTLLNYDESISLIDQQEQLNLQIPQKIGIGLAVQKSNNFRAGFDYQWEKWSSLNISDKNYDIRNSNLFSLGIEYSPNQTKRDRLYKNMFYRVGANYKNTYLKVDNTPVNSASVNFGIGIPWNMNNMFNLSLEYGKEGELNKGLIQDNYFLMYINLSIHDFWGKRARR